MIMESPCVANESCLVQAWVINGVTEWRPKRPVDEALKVKSELLGDTKMLEMKELRDTL